jgi:ABC-2 type transport system ATP-binding protein
MEEILVVQEVYKSFNGTHAVEGVSFSVRKGEIFGLLGPNGAGKTTLIRIILDILKPDRGKISFSFSSGSKKNKKEKIGYLPEERGLYEDRRVSDTLIYLARLKGMSKERAGERALWWLSKLGLEKHYHHRVKALSRGMQQKMQFIVSLLHEPELVILDEPFAGLDPVNQDLFGELIGDLQSQGVTVLLSSHQMNLVEGLCDRIFLINQGKEVVYGPLDEIKKSFGQDMVRVKFKGKFPSALKDLTESLNIKEGEAEMMLAKGVRVNEFLKEISNHVEIEEISIAKPPLHNIFVQLVSDANKKHP